MKATKIMLAVILTALCTWMFVSILVWMLSDLTLKQSATHMSTIFIMFLFGWIPSVIVGIDIDEKI